jgi:hypothetical protein
MILCLRKAHPLERSLPYPWYLLRLRDSNSVGVNVFPSFKLIFHLSLHLLTNSFMFYLVPTKKMSFNCFSPCEFYFWVSSSLQRKKTPYSYTGTRGGSHLGEKLLTWLGWNKRKSLCSLVDRALPPGILTGRGGMGSGRIGPAVLLSILLWLDPHLGVWFLIL